MFYLLMQLYALWKGTARLIMVCREYPQDHLTLLNRDKAVTENLELMDTGSEEPRELPARKIEMIHSQQPACTQLEVAVGTVKWNLKRLIAKGYVKVKRVSARTGYIITPKIALSDAAGLCRKVFFPVSQKPQRVREIFLSSKRGLRRLPSRQRRSGRYCRLTCLGTRDHVVTDEMSQS